MSTDEVKKAIVFSDGPVEIYGPLKVVNEKGQLVMEVEDNQPVYFCRCGASKDKPFCDGSHDDIHFNAPPKVK